MHGFSMERAVKKARKQLTTPKDYAVVGDGTYVLTQSDALVPPDVWVSESNRDVYNVHLRQQGARLIGTQIMGSFDTKYHINGEGRSYSLSNTELKLLLQSLDSPVIFNNNLLFPQNILDLL